MFAPRFLFAKEREKRIASPFFVRQSVSVPAGSYVNAIRTADTTAIEPDALEEKFYAPGVGPVLTQDLDPISHESLGSERLVKVELNGQVVSQVVSPEKAAGANPTGDASGPVKIGGKSLFRTDGTVFLSNVQAAKAMEIASQQEVGLTDCDLDDLRIGANERIGLTGSTINEPTDLRGNIDVFIFKSRFNADAQISLARGDNQLSIADSLFQKLNANGNAGNDTFDDLGGNTIGALTLKSFEER